MRDPLCEWGGRFMKVSDAHSRGNRYRLCEWGGPSIWLSFMKESAASASEINRGAAAPSVYPLSKGRPSLQINWRSPLGMGRPLQSVVLYEGVGRSCQ